ncbi:hypothetical protein BGX24_009118 [Mortierella sp. AD032]|nr:hypothetical protein BGX24_009118 [Mortierella sp. AD032]
MPPHFKPPHHKSTGPAKAAGHQNDQLQEAVIVPFTLTEISAFVDQTIRLLTAPGKKSVSSTSEFINIIRTIPDMEDLVKNPFLLELALEVLPSLSTDDLGAVNIKATRLQLYGEFIKHWVRINKARLERSTLSQGLLAAFESLQDSGLKGCVIDFMKELAEAIYDHQDGLSIVEYIHRRDANSWKAKFFGPAEEPTLLREASPLIRTGHLFKFLHHSFLEYFYSLVFGDPTDDPTDDGDEGLDDNGHVPDNDGDESQGAESGAGGRGGSGGSDGAFGGNQSSGGNKGGSGGDEEGSRRGRGGSHSIGKNISAKSGVDALMIRFSKRNLFKEPGVMDFLVERTRSDERLRSRLWMIIEQSNKDRHPCLAAANAITILFKSGERFLNDSGLVFITIPRDYISEGAFDPAHKLRPFWNGTVLLTILLEMADPTATWKSSSFNQINAQRLESKPRLCTLIIEAGIKSFVASPIEATHTPLNPPVIEVTHTSLNPPVLEAAHTSLIAPVLEAINASSVNAPFLEATHTSLITPRKPSTTGKDVCREKRRAGISTQTGLSDYLKAYFIRKTHI